MPRNTTTYAETATARLREEILRGGITSDSALQEKQLCERFGISRTPVRTALNTLAQEGLLDYVPQKGYRVRKFDATLVGEAYELRATLEGMACRLLAERGLDDSTAALLNECIAAGEQLLGAPTDNFDHSVWRQLNTRFHQTIYRAAGNRLLQDFVVQAERIPLASLNVIAHWNPWRPEQERNMLWRAQVDHANVVRALENRQGSRAEARMREHIQVAGELVCAKLSQAVAKTGDR